MLSVAPPPSMPTWLLPAAATFRHRRGHGAPCWLPLLLICRDGQRAMESLLRRKECGLPLAKLSDPKGTVEFT